MKRGYKKKNRNRNDSYSFVIKGTKYLQNSILYKRIYQFIHLNQIIDYLNKRKLSFQAWIAMSGSDKL